MPFATCLLAAVRKLQMSCAILNLHALVLKSFDELAIFHPKLLSNK